MLETVLMRTFVMLYSSDFECDDDRHPYKSGKSRSSSRRAFTLLCSVCSSWHYTLTGWPESPTRRWMRHQLRKLIEREYIDVEATQKTISLSLCSKFRSLFRLVWVSSCLVVFTAKLLSMFISGFCRFSRIVLLQVHVVRSSVHLGCSTCMSGMANVSCLLQLYFNNSCDTTLVIMMFDSWCLCM